MNVDLREKIGARRVVASVSGSKALEWIEYNVSTSHPVHIHGQAPDDWPRGGIALVARALSETQGAPGDTT